jgi:hypothetical protein
MEFQLNPDTIQYNEWKFNTKDLKYTEPSVKNKTWKQFEEKFKIVIEGHQQKLRDMIPSDSLPTTLGWINYDLLEITKNYGNWSKIRYERECYNTIKRTLGQKVLKKESGAIVMECRITDNNSINVYVYRENYVERDHLERLRNCLVDCKFSDINVLIK